MPYKNFEKNREYHRRYSKEYRKNNIDKIREYDRNRWYNTPGRRAYSKNNPEVRKNKNRRYRSRKRNVLESFSHSDERYILDLFENKCFNCGSFEHLEIDHIYPLFAGFALSRKNACVLCRHCNSSKHNKMPEEFFTKNKFDELMFILFPPYAS